jgi:TRIAD3 protein (E3 ubiquitin-protein ligase RNF216)
MFECLCCYNTIESDEQRVCCELDHNVCKNCILQYAQEEIYGGGKTELKCIGNSQCSCKYSESMLSNTLPPVMYQKYSELQVRNEATLAGVELRNCNKCNASFEIECDQTKCIHCNEATFMITNDQPKELTCLIQETIASVNVRTCPNVNCKKQYVRAEGCNKCRCSCGTFICYICNQKINTEYEHYSSNQCKLFTTYIEDQKMNVKRSIELLRERFAGEEIVYECNNSSGIPTKFTINGIDVLQYMELPRGVTMDIVRVNYLPYYHEIKDKIVDVSLHIRGMSPFVSTLFYASNDGRPYVYNNVLKKFYLLSTTSKSLLHGEVLQCYETFRERLERESTDIKWGMTNRYSASMIQIGDIQTDSIVSKKNIMEGDKIVSINSIPLRNFTTVEEINTLVTTSTVMNIEYIRDIPTSYLDTVEYEDVNNWKKVIERHGGNMSNVYTIQGDIVRGKFICHDGISFETKAVVGNQDNNLVKVLDKFCSLSEIRGRMYMEGEIEVEGKKYEDRFTANIVKKDPVLLERIGLPIFLNTDIKLDYVVCEGENFFGKYYMFGYLMNKTCKFYRFYLPQEPKGIKRSPCIASSTNKKQKI